MSIGRLRAGFAVGVGIGVLFVVLGVSSMVYFFTVKQVMGHSTSIYGNYFFAGVFCFFFAGLILRLSIPVFIPLKKNLPKPTRDCPFCNAVVDADAEVCPKCHRPLD